MLTVRLVGSSALSDFRILAAGLIFSLPLCMIAVRKFCLCRPVGIDECGERLDCAGLNWEADAVGRSDVCGSSILIEQFGSGDKCVREATYEDAADLCQELGSRLCTVGELGRGEGVPEACGCVDLVYRK